MKIGYACINNSLKCRANKTFRLSSYTEEKLVETIKNNLDCLKKILEYNLEHNLMFFRITSELIPFGSHEINKFDWLNYFKKDFEEIGAFIKNHDMRISMHPDQFVVLNSPKEKVIQNSIGELLWHAQVLDAMNLDLTAKIQIHVGGVYNDKDKAIEKFVETYKNLPLQIKRRLAIENDDKSYSLKDCLKLNKKIGIPIIFDNFHHECLNNKEPMFEAVKLAQSTWKKQDGVLMTDYSSQQPGERKGKHADSIDINHFKKYLEQTKDLEFDIMLEIKDKEKSALIAKQIMSS